MIAPARKQPHVAQNRGQDPPPARATAMRSSAPSCQRSTLGWWRFHFLSCWKGFQPALQVEERAMLHRPRDLPSHPCFLLLQNADLGRFFPEILAFSELILPQPSGFTDKNSEAELGLLTSSPFSAAFQKELLTFQNISSVTFHLALITLREAGRTVISVCILQVITKSHQRGLSR